MSGYTILMSALLFVTLRFQIILDKSILTSRNDGGDKSDHSGIIISFEGLQFTGGSKIWFKTPNKNSILITLFRFFSI